MIDLLNWISDTRNWLYDRLSIRCLLCRRNYLVFASCEHGYTIAGIVVAVVAAAAAGASTYMASEQAASQARDQRRRAQWQQKIEEDQAAAARRQVELRAQRHLNAQAAKAGGAGVVAGESSLLVDQLEAASMSQYEEDLAAFGHELASKTHGFESKLFKRQERDIRATEPYSIGISAGVAGASSYYGSMSKSSTPKGSGTTVATQKQAPESDNWL